MKIFSKTKDYWHYLVGVYGIDPVLIYDCRDSKKIQMPLPSNHWGSWRITIAVNNKTYQFFGLPDGQIGHTAEDILKYAQLSGYGPFAVGFGRFKPSLAWAQREYQSENNLPTKINQERRQPILVEQGWSGWFVPTKLDDIKFHRVMDAHTIYTEVSEFLGWLNDNPEAPDNQTNKEKVVSHGFDLKTSFRPNIKKVR